MLLETETFFTNAINVLPANHLEEVIKNLLMNISKNEWFDKLYLDIQKQKNNSFVVKCKYEKDTDLYPSRFEEYQIRYTWDGKKDLTIQEACEKFKRRYGKEQWFHSIRITDGKILDVTLKSRKNKLLDHYENFPVQYGYLKKNEDE